jgi:hypothetical protein
VSSQRRPNLGTKAEIREGFKRANDILQLARSENIRLNPQLIASYGKTVAAISSEPSVSDSAWQTLGNLLDYRTFLNVDLSPALKGPPLEHAPYYHFQVMNRNPLTMPTVSAYGEVPLAQAAVLNPIGKHLNEITMEGEKRTSAAEFLVLDGDELILDGMEMKNIILRNVKIRYYGSRVMMENVYFINCTFTFPPRSQMPIELREHNIPIEKPNSSVNKQLLADKILESPSVTFTAS